jgi:hypothetical protein
MGPHRAKALIGLLMLGTGAALAQEPGWHYSPLPGEGDRASLGCAKDSNAQNYTCLAVRCEDDYTTGVHVHSSRAGGAAGNWEFTLDRDTRSLVAEASEPYGGRFADEDGWLLDGLRHGTFVYLRHEGDADGGFALISLAGSFSAIAEALQWCAPRVLPDEQNGAGGVETITKEGEPQ